MQPEDLILVSVDDHLVEPPNLFEGRVATKYADQTPRVIRQPDGSEVWTFNGAIIPNIGLNAVAGRPREEYGVERTAFDEMRPGCYDIHERIKDMNAGGVLGSIADPVGVKLRHDIGIDNIAWECDYPHSDSSWPMAAEELALVMVGLPDDEINKITYENACRWYSFDPFQHRIRERCTVGALRAEAGDHDVEIRSFDNGRFERTVGAPLGSMSAKLDV